MVTLVTEGIKVSVKVNFEPQHSDAFKFAYFFSYRISIENQSIYTVQLLHRRWIIFDSCGLHRAVEGEGVIGQCPVIEPGSRYEYESFCDLSTDIGTMKGYYSMIRQVDNKKITAEIPEFLLITPFRLN